MREIISEGAKDTKYVLVDVETGGLCLHNCYTLPWQVAYISVVNNEIVKKANYYIKWPDGKFRISRGAAAKNRYDQSFIDQHGVAPESIIDDVINELDSADHVVGHNILGLDVYVIQSLCRELGRKPYSFASKAVDTFALAKGIRLENFPKTKSDFIAWQYRMIHYIRKGLNKLKLEDLGREYSIEHNYALLHDALVDLELNLKVFNKQRYSFKWNL